MINDEFLPGEGKYCVTDISQCHCIMESSVVECKAKFFDWQGGGEPNRCSFLSCKVMSLFREDDRDSFRSVTTAAYFS